ncbi:MAG TPA: glycosyltransferase [Actinophytocola sp.]|uniref:glycosyltransferase n=1 Tax=Actinophytocola sp. TaxID=1872138 RepID=UPI002DB7D678|nr:glycosyltransferase [Actinophytocola sp.]HEU5472963.1 glycosyltransferase [Actinophytocola sp.]
MRFLFITGGSPACVFAVAPLASAARNAGHEVFMAANEDLIPDVTGAGIPGISMTPHPVKHFVWKDRAGNELSVPWDRQGELRHLGGAFGRMAADSLDVLLELAGDWRPDIVVGGALSYAAPLLAAHLGVPSVRHAWDMTPTTDLDPGAAEELAPELRRLGLDRVPEPDLFVDITPPSLRRADAPDGLTMRWAPGSRQRRLERWMYTRTDDRPRALVTAGSRPYIPAHVDLLPRLTRTLSAAGIEVLLAGPQELVESLGAGLDEVKAGWIPLEVAARTCDLMVHHGGGVTTMGALNVGIPQLMLPKSNYQVESTQPVAEFGAGLLLTRDQDTIEEIEKCCLELLSNPSYASRAGQLAAEIATLPPPAEVVGTLENLVTP